METIELLSQATINVLGYFLPSFAIMLAVSWVVSLFSFRR